MNNRTIVQLSPVLIQWNNSISEDANYIPWDVESLAA